jgi:hypothetical protein
LEVSEEVKTLTLKALSKLNVEVNEGSLEVKYFEERNKRYNVYGRFSNSIGIYEFRITFDDKGNPKREHINLISPIKVRKEVEKKVYAKDEERDKG